MREKFTTNSPAISFSADSEMVRFLRLQRKTFCLSISRRSRLVTRTIIVYGKVAFKNSVPLSNVLSRLLAEWTSSSREITKFVCCQPGVGCVNRLRDCNGAYLMTHDLVYMA